MLYLIIRSLALILFKILFRLQVLGQRNIPLQGGFILAANHASYLDPPILGAASARAVNFLAKEQLFKNALFGAFISRLRAFPIKTHSADLKSLRCAIEKLKRGEPLVIFPEGGRTADNQLEQPLGGIGFLAAKTGVCIVPAYIEGSNRALPVHSKFIHLEKVRVSFGKPFFPVDTNTQVNKKDLYQAIAARTMAEITKLKKEMMVNVR